MFAIQRKLDTDLFGWQDFINYNTKPKWWQFWKRF